MASIKELLQAMINKINGKNEGVDWNENDETSPAFVKNRPFYKEFGDVTVIPEQTPVLMANEDGLYMYNIIVQHIPNIGDEYTVTLDDQHYTCIATSINGTLVLGNASIHGLGPDTGEPFIIHADNYPYISSLSPIEKLISCTTKGFVYNSVPMEYLDNAAKTVHIDSHSITLERAIEIDKSKPDLVIWYGDIFNSFSLQEGTIDGLMCQYINLYDAVGCRYYIVNENDEFNKLTSLRFSSVSYPKFGENLRADISVNENYGCPAVSANSVRSGNATEDIMFRVTNNGLKNKKEFRVQGNGTVESYSMILPSTTAGSTKQFRITVDDSGTISATEVT